MPPISSATADIVRSGLRSSHILVVGDLILDRYLWGEVTRISPEAPVPVVRSVRTSEVAGGAANVALNIVGLGVRVSVAGCIGHDESGIALGRLLRATGVDTTAMRVIADRPTTTKTRIMGGQQQMLRLDTEETSPLSAADIDELVAAVRDRLGLGIEVVVLSDYAKGVLCAAACRAIIGFARARGIPVLVDPKGRDFRKYAGATVLTPNRVELAHATGTDPDDLEALLRAGESLRSTTALPYLVVTRGADGISLLHTGGAEHFPAVARQVFDVSGAGDTVMAALAAGLGAGLNISEALRLGNIAAGIVVAKVGTVAISMDELHRELVAHEQSGLGVTIQFAEPNGTAMVAEQRFSAHA